MIKPISISNQFVLKNQQIKKQQKESVGKQSYADFSGYQVGQALKAQSGIGFKQNSMPVEVTHLYNKKVEGKDHLDLPNVHVYEYPDTNLQLFVNVDNNIKQNEQSIIFFINNQNSNSIENGILKCLIEKKFYEILPNGFVNIDGDGICYGLNYDSEFNKNVVKLNEIVINSDFSEEDLNDAKKNFMDYIKSDIYKDSVNLILLLYEPNQIKSNEEIIKEINDLKIEDIENYYQNLKQNSTIQAYLTIAPLDLKKNQNEVLKNINSSISERFESINDSLNTDEKFELNKNLKFVNTDSNEYAFYFPVKLQDSKDLFMSQLVSCVLNDVSNLYEVDTETYFTPYELKEKCLQKHNNKFFKFKLDSNVSLSDFSKILEELNVVSSLKKVKEYQKQRIKDILSKKDLSDIKTNEIFVQDKDIFSVYETIDSITEEDVKVYIKEYFIKQMPIIQNGE